METKINSLFARDNKCTENAEKIQNYLGIKKIKRQATSVHNYSIKYHQTPDPMQPRDLLCDVESRRPTFGCMTSSLPSVTAAKPAVGCLPSN